MNLWCVQTDGLRAMVEKATELGLYGAAAAMVAIEPDPGYPVIWSPSVRTVGKWVDVSSTSRTWKPGIHFVSSTLATIGEMLETGRSITSNNCCGEESRLEQKDTMFLAAYAGGTDSQNQQIAEEGIRVLKASFEALTELETLKTRVAEAFEDFSRARAARRISTRRRD